MSLRTDPQRAREVGQLLLDAFQGGDILGEVSMPEHILPAGVQRGSREHLHFITLTVAIDYQRDADALWEASRLSYADPKTRYLYKPHQAARSSTDDVIADMHKHGLSRKPEKDPGIWRDICVTLANHFDGQVYNLLERVSFNAPVILETIRDGRYRFPYLKGPKIGPLWLRMLEDSWQGRHLDGLEKLPIPVDVHIAAASVMTGCVLGPFEGAFEKVRKAVADVWFSACQGTDHFPLQFDEALWHLSRRGCRKTEAFPCECRNRCPVAEFCTEARLVTSENRVSVDSPAKVRVRAVKVRESTATRGGKRSVP